MPTSDPDPNNPLYLEKTWPDGRPFMSIDGKPIEQTDPHKIGMGGKPLRPLQEILPHPDPVPLEIWRKRLLDKNDMKPKSHLMPETAVQIIEKATAAIEDETNKATLIAVFTDPESLKNPIRKAHKFELALSKILKVAFKEFGFTTGVDAKQALSRLDTERYLDDATKAAYDKFEAAYKLIEEHRGASESPSKKKKAPAAAAPVAAPAAEIS